MAETEESQETEENDDSASGLKKLALRGSVVQFSGYIANYGLRFVSSTILRSLLFPAAFGVMEIINGVTIGLIMLSDVGIMQAVIRSDRGDDAVFLNTAWTIHVVRGVILWVVACLIAYPTALITNTPEVAYLIPVATVGVVGLGFHSTAEFTLRRRMQLGRVITMEVVAQVATVATTITWASIAPSVWALVAGGLVNVAVKLAWSYYMAAHVGFFNKFAWDKSVRDEIWDFGKWITGSSAVFFVSQWGDRLMLVAFLGTEVAGIYATAVMIAEAVSALFDKIIHSVFYPLFSRVGRESIDKLREVFYQTRLRFDVLSMSGAGGLLVLGPWVCDLLFDDRYQAAGWMLRVLCIRSACIATFTPAETCLTSLGHSRYGFYQNVVRAIWILVGVPIGYYGWGLVGVIWVTALSGFPPYLVVWPKLRELKILRFDREALAWVFFGVGAAVGYGLLLVLPDADGIRDSLKELIQ